MTQLQFFQLSALPASLAPNAFYFVLSGNVAESYLTTAGGTPKSIGNTAMINGLIDARLNAASTLLHVPNIQDRDALSPASNAMVLVTDATGDPSVQGGGALYFYDAAQSAYTKVAEYESMDLVLQWANISGRPGALPGDIDAAVAEAHSHANKAVLDALGDASGGLTYNGAPIAGASSWAQTDW